MNDYDELYGKLIELAKHFQQCTMGAWHDRGDSVSDSTRQYYEGQSDAFKQAKESVDKIIKESPGVSL